MQIKQQYVLKKKSPGQRFLKLTFYTSSFSQPFPEFRKKFFPLKVSCFPWRWDSFVLIGFTTVGVLSLLREIGFYSSGRAESPKGDGLFQQWACWVSQRKLAFATVGVVNLPREIGFDSSGLAESSKESVLSNKSGNKSTREGLTPRPSMGVRCPPWWASGSTRDLLKMEKPEV